jgi:hypothetical protein
MLEDDELRRRLKAVERGTFFEKIVRNFTEGDFFGWYCDEWTDSIAQQVRVLLQALSDFDPDSVEQAPERVRDLLKRLYHGLLPRQVRHDLGEYYTPDWLAERLLSQLDNELFGSREAEIRRELASRVRSRLLTTRFIDPSCGSGTFIVLIIRTLRRWARESGISESDKLLPALLSNVVGFDLNPLAVISSRANFLLSVADLLKSVEEPIELPIYLADSIVLPAEEQGGALFTRGIYELPLRGVGKQFVVPELLANREHLNILARVLRVDIEEGVSVDAFLQRSQSQFGLPLDQWERCEPHLRNLYNTIAELHRDGKNGLWADIARNMFMPLFVQGADFVVGNPPWVNFESLPQHYRDRSKPIWEEYGLFVHEGIETILGKGKKDVSTLLTYVAADLYLKPRGKLGFVITQSVFKTSGASQGFRRFSIPASHNGHGKRRKETDLCILHVDDFSSMQPFEGATNRTAVFVMQKNRSNRYPVDYTVWKKTGSRNVPFKATLDEAMPMLSQKRLKAKPVDETDYTSSWLTAREKALSALGKVLGESSYQAYEGANSGGANAVYWFHVVGQNRDGTMRVRNITEGSKREIEGGVHDLEPDLLYPLLRGRDCKKWRAEPEEGARFLIVQDPETRRGIPEPELRRTLPRTYKYLEKYEHILRQRRSQAVRKLMEHSFYSMFGIGRHTFAPYKVVWAEVGHELLAAVTEPNDSKITIPDHTVVLIACDNPVEAHFLCAILNSSPAHLLIQNYIVGHPDSHVMNRVNIPRLDADNKVHVALANLSRRAHEVVREGKLGELAKIEGDLDKLAAQVWSLSQLELTEIQRTLAEL